MPAICAWTGVPLKWNIEFLRNSGFILVKRKDGRKLKYIYSQIKRSKKSQAKSVEAYSSSSQK